jgi:hypothetical protein
LGDDSPNEASPGRGCDRQASFKDIGEISDEEWELTFKVNIHAMFCLTKAAVSSC